MRLTLPAVAASVPEVRHALTALARELGAPDRVVADVALAVSEACTNVVLHAYRELEEPGTLTIDAAPHAGVLEVLVSDEGSGLRARDDSPGLGMGMALMAAVATGLQMDHDGAATRVHLTFDLRMEAAHAPDADAETAA